MRGETPTHTHKGKGGHSLGGMHGEIEGVKGTRPSLCSIGTIEEVEGGGETAFQGLNLKPEFVGYSLGEGPVWEN